MPRNRQVERLGVFTLMDWWYQVFSRKQEGQNMERKLSDYLVLAAMSAIGLLVFYLCQLAGC